ncbi:hypothetical protein EVAR_71110_1 [Eumeta japonica]|uniref:Uncharacterized protein n=1 Tax=Eumeta variegata TaxID=151549 RepID=A0A4C2AFK1_EUMVA|nr:hypothetical protein EVAR_71110_1 [Eumeta japonica]
MGAASRGKPEDQSVSFQIPRRPLMYTAAVAIYRKEIDEFVATDERASPAKIPSPRPSSDLTAGVDSSMTVSEAEGGPGRLAGSALRRLHYRATRRAHSAAAAASARHHNPPKRQVGSTKTAGGGCSHDLAKLQPDTSMAETGLYVTSLRLFE